MPTRRLAVLAALLGLALTLPLAAPVAAQAADQSATDDRGTLRRYAADTWRSFELLIEEAERRDWGARTTAGHLCAMASWEDDYAAAVIARAASSVTMRSAAAISVGVPSWAAWATISERVTDFPEPGTPPTRRLLYIIGR